jgi:CRP-like cAMP-binding protein
MSFFTASPISNSNRILLALSQEEYPLLFSSLHPVPLVRGRVLYRLADSIQYAFFPLSGMISLVAVTQNGSATEISMVGNEGVVGIPALLGVNKAPYQIEVQIAGNAMKIKSNVLIREFGRAGPLQKLMLRYIHSLISQISQSSACNRFHQVEERLGRWLLISRDRVQSDTLRLTHEALSHMLGASRTNVTAAANKLKTAGLIEYHRGSIRILDPAGLERAACECYRALTKELGHFRAA